LWDEAIDLVTSDHKDNFYTEVFEKIWLDKLPSPYLLYVRLLLEYFEVEEEGDIVYPNAITKGRFLDLKYQKDAISKGISIINQHNGVLIADVVGLGKSIIASAIAYNLKKKVIIIASPVLEYQWTKVYGPQFDLTTQFFGPRSIHKAIEYHQNNLQGEEVVVIVDEAHNFRNEKSENYLLLHQLCQGNKVILLTATPFNNKPQDLFAMLKLFQIPYKSTIRGDSNLADRMTSLIKEFNEIEAESRNDRLNRKISDIEYRKRMLGQRIRDILQPIIIRRSRLDIDSILDYKKDLEKQKVRYILADPPVEKEYYLGSLSALYLRTLQRITPLSKNQHQVEEESKPNNQTKRDKLIGARYKPVDYVLDQESLKRSIEEQGVEIEYQIFALGQRNLASLMMRSLASRFESSIESFRKTLNQLIKSMLNIKGYYENLGVVPVLKKGSIPNYAEIDVKDIPMFQFMAEEMDEMEIELNTAPNKSPKGLFYIDKTLLSEQFIEDLNSDIDLLTDIQKEWFGEDGKYKIEDPKINHFIQEIKTELANDSQRKIVVFSEYSDTVNYVQKELEKNDIKCLSYTSQEKKDEIVRENFDASHKPQKDDYQVLIATDAISEGWNLNRAGTVFNYDIPYNPTRILQRVGRINRIGQMLFDNIYIYNYFPTDIGEREVRRREISTFKKSIIDAILGEDTQIITSEEALESYFNEEYKKKQNEYEEKSWDAEARNDLYYLKQHDQKTINEAKALPHKSRIKRSEPKGVKGVIIFGKRGKNYVFRLGTNADYSEELTAQSGIALFKADKEEKALELTDSFEPIYQKAKSDMFTSLSDINLSLKLRQVIGNIEYLIDECSEEAQYLEDLLKVAKELNSLPDYAQMIIRRAIKGTPSSIVKKLKQQIPHSYLTKIINRAESIEDEVETIILAEELAQK
ncbi:MAG: helicase-related protein, partial [Candidatus Cloacimonas sp.]